jgi:hypothetical protein
MRIGLSVLFANGTGWTWSGDVPVPVPASFPGAEEWLDAMMERWIAAAKAAHPGSRVFLWSDPKPEWQEV